MPAQTDHFDPPGWMAPENVANSSACQVHTLALQVTKGQEGRLTEQRTHEQGTTIWNRGRAGIGERGESGASADAGGSSGELRVSANAEQGGSDEWGPAHCLRVLVFGREYDYPVHLLFCRRDPAAVRVGVRAHVSDHWRTRYLVSRRTACRRGTPTCRRALWRWSWRSSRRSRTSWPS